MCGNILAIENQKAIINDVIEIACICIKLKQIQLITAKDTTSSSDENFTKVILYGRWSIGLPVVFV